MGRLERNIRRKKRRRTIIFSLLVILLLFISGIKITNSVMVRMTGLSQEDNFFSGYNISMYLRNIRNFANEAEWIVNGKKIIENFIYRIQRLADGLVNRM